MDLNELYHRHQVSVARAAMAGSPEARLAHAGLARGYARLIDQHQHDAGVSAPTIVHSS